MNPDWTVDIGGNAQTHSNNQTYLTNTVWVRHIYDAFPVIRQACSAPTHQLHLTNIHLLWALSLQSRQTYYNKELYRHLYAHTGLIRYTAIILKLCGRDRNAYHSGEGKETGSEGPRLLVAPTPRTGKEGWMDVCAWWLGSGSDYGVPLSASHYLKLSMDAWFLRFAVYALTSPLKSYTRALSNRYVIGFVNDSQFETLSIWN